MAKPLNIIFIGLSGSGKGTQIELICRDLEGTQKVHVIATGELIRNIAKQDTHVGKQVKTALSRGELMPSAIAVSAWAYPVAWSVREEEGIIFDGSPRKAWEAEIMDDLLVFLERQDTTKVIYLHVDPKEVTRRLLKRGRDDDFDAAIMARIDYFHTNVIPVLEYYRSRNRLIEINGEQAVEKVHEDIVQALGI